MLQTQLSLMMTVERGRVGVTHHRKRLKSQEMSTARYNVLSSVVRMCILHTILYVIQQQSPSLSSGGSRDLFNGVPQVVPCAV